MNTGEDYSNTLLGPLEEYSRRATSLKLSHIIISENHFRWHCQIAYKKLGKLFQSKCKCKIHVTDDLRPLLSFKILKR